MCLQDMINVCFTGDLDMVTCLMYIDTIVAYAKTLGIELASAFAFGGCMSIDDGNHFVGSSSGRRGDGEVVNLSAHEH